MKNKAARLKNPRRVPGHTSSMVGSRENLSHAVAFSPIKYQESDSVSRKPEVPQNVLAKWQDIVDLMAEIVGVPAGLIMKVGAEQIEVLVSSVTKGNPYSKGEEADLNTGLYCETVMRQRNRLLVSDARKDLEWAQNPDIKLGMVSYLGYPLLWPDGEIFGTICVLDNKENFCCESYVKLVSQFKDIIEADLKLLIGQIEHKQVEERRRILSIAVEQSSEGVAVVDLGDRLLFVNETFAEMHGYAAAELIGKHLSIFHTPEQMQSVESANSQIKETGEFIGEIWHVRCDGTVFPTMMHNSLLRDEDGNPFGMIGTVRDITERKRAERALQEAHDMLEMRVQERTAELQEANKKLRREIEERKRAEEALRKSEERFRAQYQAIPIPTFTWKKTDNDFVLVDYNDAAANFTEEKVTDFVGRTLSEMYQHMPEVIENMHRCYHSKTTIRRHMRYRFIYTGREKDLSVSYSYVPHNLVIVHTEDITDRMQAEEELKQSNHKLNAEHAALEEKNIALRELLYQIDNETDQMARRVQSNVDRVVIPILRKLREKAGPLENISLLQNSLTEITSPFINKLETRFMRLSPREIEICNMIKNGLTSKEIASALNTSQETVRNQRKAIRSKLGISNDKINLMSFLQSM